MWPGHLLFKVISEESQSLKVKVINYISDPWNILDLVTLVTFLVAIVLYILADQIECHSCFKPAKVIHTLNMMTFFFRVLHYFSVHRELGPKLVMIGKMVSDSRHNYVEASSQYILYICQ